MGRADSMNVGQDYYYWLLEERKMKSKYITKRLVVWDLPEKWVRHAYILTKNSYHGW